MWRALSIIFLIAIAGAGYYLLTPEGRELIDRVRINLMRADYKARFRAGETLPRTPDLARFDERLAAHGVKLGVPVYIRIFKLESELELWVEKEGRFERFATYPICLWSGRLGPKLREGDRQAPEGFYTVASEQLNPNSVMHRSFNLGFPNAFDQAHGRTGSFLMVHGGCASIGCFAVTDPAVDEIWRLVTAALDQGQARFPVHVFPFRMTDSAVKARQRQQMGEVLGRPQEGLRFVRAEPHPARRQRVRGPLRVRGRQRCNRRKRRRGALPARNRRQFVTFRPARRRQ